MNFYLSAILAAIDWESPFWIFFGAIMQSIIVFGSILIVIFIFIWFRNKDQRKVQKMLDKAFEYEENGDYEKAYSQHKFYMENVELTGDDYYRMMVFCRNGKESGWKHYGEEYDPVYWLKKAAEENHPDAKLELLKLRYELANSKFNENFPGNISACIDAIKDLQTLDSENYDEACGQLKYLEMKLSEKAKKGNQAAFDLLYKIYSEVASYDYEIYLGGFLPPSKYKSGEKRYDINFMMKYAESKLEEESGDRFENAAKWFAKAGDRGSGEACYKASQNYYSSAEEFAKKNGLDFREKENDLTYIYYTYESNEYFLRSKELGYEPEE